MFQILLQLAWRQHGAFSTSQAEALGVSRSTISRHCRDGSILRAAPAVYVLAGTPDTPRRRAMVEILAAGLGAMATSKTGLALWCDEIEPPDRPVLAVPRSCGYRSPRAEVRRSRDLDLAKGTVIDGIPVVGVGRALLDASVGRTPDAVLGLIDSCRRHLPLSTGALVETLRLHSQQGRLGIAVFRQALLLLGATVTDSEFERLVVRDLVSAGLPEPTLHQVVRLPGADPIELDISWPPLPLDVELDGVDHVARVEKARRDRLRDRLLTKHGWDVPRFMWRDYVADHGAMIAEIVERYEQHARRRGLVR